MLDFSSFLPPYQPVELPSRGKFYTSNPALKDGWVHVREYCAQEESLLAQMNRENVQHILNAIINNCLEGSNVTAEELTSEDAFYLLVWLRANSYGPSYDIEVECPHRDCAQQDTHIINLANLTINYLTEEDPEEPITIVLPKTRIKVDVCCLRRSMELEATKRQMTLKQMKGLHKGDTTDLLKRAYSISSVTTPDGQSTSDRLAIENLCLKYLPSADSLAIDESLEKFRHGVDVNIELTCNACGRPIFTVVPPGPEFFRPTRTSLETEGKSASGDTNVKQVRETGLDVPQVDKSVGATKANKSSEGHLRTGSEGTQKADG
jgi:hypothetical protein